MIRERVEGILRRALEAAVEAGSLPEAVLEAELNVEPPKKAEWGDFACTAALGLAKIAKKSPRDIAEAIRAQIPTDQGVVDKVDIAGAGFLNLTLSRDFWHGQLHEMLAEGEMFGHSTVGAGEKALVEFVSANPTGPLHIGHARNAAVGDTLGNILQAAGWEVSREFYINDVGVQMDKMGRSVWHRYRELLGKGSFPDQSDLYGGDYIRELAESFAKMAGDAFAEPAGEVDGVPEPSPEALETAREFAYPVLKKEISDTLAAFNVHFDRWYSEREVQGHPKFQSITLAGATFEARIDLDSATCATLHELDEKGHLFFEDGALWFRSTAFGDDKDRVMIKADGYPTYFTPDVAYHHGKLERGFELLVDVWGADHHGYIPRMRAGLQALGWDPNKFQVVLIQMVRLFRGGEPVKMSKRTGDLVALQEVIDEVGADAARFTLLTRSSDAQFDFDLEVAKKQTDENPVFYVQYGHARVCSLYRKALETGVFEGAETPDAVRTAALEADLSALETDTELAMIRLLSRFPEAVGEAATRREPHRVVFYLQDLVKAFHAWYADHRVVNADDPRLTAARLALAEGIRLALANGLQLCGVSAPDRMERTDDA